MGYEDQRGFRPGFQCKSQIVSVCQDVADSLDEGAKMEAIMIDFSISFDLITYDRLLMKIVASGVDSRVFI